MNIYFLTFNFIRKYQPYSVYFLIVIFLLSSFIEAIGISFVMPVIALVLDENFLKILENSSFGKYAPNFILNMSHTTALTFFSTLVIAIYITKNIVLIITEYLKAIFINNIKERISTLVMNKYLHQDYLYHSKKDVSEINSIINQKIDDLTNGLLSAVLIIISELIMIFGLLILIIFFNQLNTFLILCALFIAGIILSKTISVFIKKIANKRQESLGIKFDNFSSIINNFREIILTGRTGLYFFNFTNSLKTIAKMDAIRATFQRAPQLIFETLGIAGLIIIIYYLLFLNASSVKIIATCTFFAAICYRAIPSLNKILYFHYNVKYYLPIFKEIIKEINIENKTVYHNKKLIIKKYIGLQNIYFKYDKKNNFTFKKLDIRIKSGSTVGIFGKSGTGKTTFLDLISGLVTPNRGSLFVDNKKINNSYLRRKLQNNISYISQKTTVINDTLKKNICFGIEDNDIDIDRYNLSIKICGLESIQKNFDKQFKKISDFGKNISGGQLQRIGIARAIYQDKDVLIFDEATNALDEELEEQIVSNLIKIKKNKILIFVSHNKKMLKKFDDLYEVKNFKIFKIK